MSHGFYIYLSYGISAFVVTVLFVWIYVEGKARQRELAELQASGIRRRSAESRGGSVK